MPIPVGHKHSLETKLKIGAAHRGMKRSPEARANMSASCQTRRKKMDRPEKLEYYRKYNAARREKQIGRRRGEKHPCVDCGKPVTKMATRCHSCCKKGKRHPNWKGGRTMNNGYVCVYCPGHPYAFGGHVFEHRLVMEDSLGRILLPTEEVHHINSIKTDNRIENLMRFDSKSNHRKYEGKKP